MNYKVAYGCLYKYNLNGGFNGAIVTNQPYITDFVTVDEIYLQISTHIPFLSGFQFIGYKLKGLVFEELIKDEDMLYQPGQRLLLSDIFHMEYKQRNKNDENYIELELVAQYKKVEENQTLMEINFSYDESSYMIANDCYIDSSIRYDSYDASLGYVIPSPLQSNVKYYISDSDRNVSIPVNHEATPMLYKNHERLDYLTGMKSRFDLSFLGFGLENIDDYKDISLLGSKLLYPKNDTTFTIPVPVTGNSITLYAVYLPSYANRLLGSNEEKIIGLIRDGGKETYLYSYSSKEEVVYHFYELKESSPCVIGYSFREDASIPEFYPYDFISLNTKACLPLYKVYAKTRATLSILFQSEGEVEVPLKKEYDTFFHLRYQLPNKIPTREGYQFLGWKYKDQVYQPNQFCHLTLEKPNESSILIFTAVWKLITINPHSKLLRTGFVKRAIQRDANEDLTRVKEILQTYPFAPVTLPKEYCVSLRVRTKQGWEDLM